MGQKTVKLRKQEIKAKRRTTQVPSQGSANDDSLHNNGISQAVDKVLAMAQKFIESAKLIAENQEEGVAALHQVAPKPKKNTSTAIKSRRSRSHGPSTSAPSEDSDDLGAIIVSGEIVPKLPLSQEAPKSDRPARAASKGVKALLDRIASNRIAEDTEEDADADEFDDSEDKEEESVEDDDVVEVIQAKPVSGGNASQAKTSVAKAKRKATVTIKESESEPDEEGERSYFHW